MPLSDLLPSLGVDPKRARLREGRLASLAAAALGAQAFVLGRQVFLSAGAARSIASRSHAGLALLAHELAHVEQYRRHGAPRFLFRYFFEYFALRARGRSHAVAYAGIAFEREAEERAAAYRRAAANGEISPEGFPGAPLRGA